MQTNQYEITKSDSFVFKHRIISRLLYIKRIFSAYLFNKKSGNLSFWHTPLEINRIEDYSRIEKYYMNFAKKTKFKGPFDSCGIPMLDYKGALGVQYNPNAIAQYAFGYYDLFIDTGNSDYKKIFLNQADWFVNNIRYVENDIGLWEYNFNFEYHKGLKSPWRSALAQGQGISVLARAYKLTNNEKYLEAATKAFNSFLYNIDQPGGVTYIDSEGYTWFEELIFNPPTHVLNGFVWALWGVYDYYLLTGDEKALQLYNESVRTLEDNIHKYDTGFWSVYHLLATKLEMVTSFYYQRLHIVQLKVMYGLTGKEKFKEYAEKWEAYFHNPAYKTSAFFWKILFKLFYY